MADFSGLDPFASNSTFGPNVASLLQGGGGVGRMSQEQEINMEMKRRQLEELIQRIQLVREEAARQESQRYEEQDLLTRLGLGAGGGGGAVKWETRDDTPTLVNDPFAQPAGGTTLSGPGLTWDEAVAGLSDPWAAASGQYDVQQPANGITRQYEPARIAPRETEMYGAGVRNREGGFTQTAKVSPALQNLQQLRIVMGALKDAPTDLKTQVLTKLTGIPLTTEKAQALENAIITTKLKHKLEEPGRAETRAISRDRLAETTASNKAQQEFRDQLLDQRAKEAEGRQMGRMKQIGEAIQAMESRSGDLIKMYGEEGYQKLKQQLNQMYLMTLIQGLGGEMPAATVKRRE